VYKDTKDTKDRAQELACDVGITAEIAEIFTSRIPDNTNVSFEEQSTRKEDNYLKIWHILDQIAGFKGVLDTNYAFDSFADSLEQDYPDIRNSICFKRFAVFEITLTMRFPHEVKKEELSDAEVSALYSWLTNK